MSFAILLADEVRGFLKSRVMLVLGIGMPVVALVVHALQPDLEGEMPLAVFSTLLVSVIGGTIAAVMLSVGIIHERLRGVYALFLVRPVRRAAIVLAKYVAVVSCVAAAAALTIAAGWAWDTLAGRSTGTGTYAAIGTSAATGLATIAISSAAGLLIGIAAPSVLVGVILVIYGANQVSALGFVPVLLKLEPAWVYSLAIGAALATVLLVVSVVLFERKQF